MDDGNGDTCNSNDKKSWSSNLHISRCHRLWVHRGRGCHGGHISGHPCSSCHHLGGRMCYWLFANMDSKTYVSVFHVLSNSIFPFLSHLFPSLDILILQQVSFCAPAPRFQAKKDSLECQCEVGLSSPPLGDAGGQILVMKWDWGRILVLWEPSVQTFGWRLHTTCKVALQFNFFFGAKTIKSISSLIPS